MITPSSLRALKEQMKVSKIALGTNLGAASRLMVSTVLSDLKSFDVFYEDDMRTISRAGALELFPRPASA